MEEEKFSSVDVRELALKCTSKREVYQTLCVTGNIYLTLCDQINSDYVSDVLSGDKLFLRGDEVKVIEVPQIEGLRIPDIIAFAREHCEIDKFLPIYETDRHPSRKWICNVVNTLMHDKFKQFVKQKIVESNIKNDVKKNNKILVLSTFASVFANTKFISKTHGRFHQMVKNSKKKREDKMNKVKLQIENKKVQEYLEDQEKRILNLKEELHEYKESLL